MRNPIRSVSLFFTAVGLVLAGTGYMTGCVGGTEGGGGLGETVPTWIVASWSGGATGNPTDRTDTEATEFTGSLCPASSLLLTNQSGGFAGLTLVNNCAITVTYAVCATKGSDQSGELNGLKNCAQDPFDTSFSDLTFVTLTNGPDGFGINATENLSISVFFCSDSQTLSGPPITDRVSCL